VSHDIQRAQPQNAFTVQRKRLAAGGYDSQVGTAGQEISDEISCGFDDMLAVVEDQQ
jgi:hypothetical protein